MNLSIVIPLLNEEDSLEELFSRIDKVCTTSNLSYEIWFVDDGSTDLSWSIIENMKVQYPQIHAIKFSRNYGKSQALHAAFERTNGDVVITMDADLQDFPEEIPELYNMVIHDNYDIVSGWKKKRFDNVMTKNIPSKLFNAAARKVSGVYLHDFNCGLKAYKRQVVKSVDVYGDMHRYIPVLAANAGFRRITEKEVQHQARPYGTSKFGTERFVRGFLDLITLWFVSRFGGRPMHFFGAVGTLMFIVGFLSALWLGISKLIDVARGIYGHLITNNPWFFIALTMMIMGTLLFIAGFLGEMIIRTNREHKNYNIDEVI
ncbi:glycosyltransferase involved in cell wall biosynthesis [Chryseobacterium bernardetii]|jgi:glycosyltransferase involved in cell wall biosynthesis|uniref:Glycosyltransferase involved in cell wall biosynthesis n=2 Tax=Chryseobacterium TaxID=59732 RepID=A0A543EJV8_9FLAO|nr:MULTISPECIES: glycosyltransferase family 2 protein [Chryseobacterium]MDR6370239.1 glycosyltransferase involved in cell wall biosynthesis [Chryseobacterium vietnamense]MDR6440518.1 glycosyltransferase involved in cell wall biosynthesis [Chryseobacterium bernardetii]MDR6486916.1 glycosyltransferase involved in cell wall biosynthesis [Chryseobacterium vietnamense]TQM21853.1 glycosyltransferase involved in cell wall biosynthesis [Chryseobacterium aquifrigidense]